MLFPGEAEAIETVKRLGEQYGYGNLIYHLRNAWSERLRKDSGIPKPAADMAAGHVCVWCETDTRTGEKQEATPDAR
jgi:hypothetical protein